MRKHLSISSSIPSEPIEIGSIGWWDEIRNNLAELIDNLNPQALEIQISVYEDDICNDPDPDALNVPSWVIAVSADDVEVEE